MMSEKGDAKNHVVRHLQDAIERVRRDMAQVEFWADAVTGFAEPVPDYDAREAKVWLPTEQAKSISPDSSDAPAEPQQQATTTNRDNVSMVPRRFNPAR